MFRSERRDSRASGDQDELLRTVRKRKRFRGAQGAAPEVTITGANTREAVVRGVDQLVQEIEAREDALARASSHAEEALNKAAADLSHQWSLFSIMLKSMEKKNKGKQDELAHREQLLVAREAELETGARDLELRREELKTEVEQRLAEAEKKHQAALDEVTKDAREAHRKEEEV